MKQNFGIAKITLSFILIPILIIVNIFLVSIPLTNVIGYEFSVANAIIQSLFIGIISIYFLRKDKEDILHIFKNNLSTFLLVLVLPFILSIGETLIFQDCPLCDGISFYLVITLPSFFIGITVGAFSFHVSQRYSYLIFVSVYILILFSFVGEIFSNPQIYFYNPIMGFFPGTIYDEDIAVDFTLVQYRVLNLLFFAGIFFLIIKNRFEKKSNKILYSALILVIALIFSLLKPKLGFSTDFPRIRNELSSQLKTEHFNIIYPSSIQQSKIENLALHHEYYYEEIKKILNIEPEFRITSFIFDSGEQKRKLFGADRADVAKPWLYQIYVNFDNYDQSLKHELAHVFSAEFGVTPFKLADGFNPAMIEGLAMAVENNYDDNEIHFMAYLAQYSGYEISIKNLFSGLNFFGQTSSISYIYAGSFIKYLGDKYGFDKIKNLYGDIDFNQYFDSDIGMLSEEYLQFLSEQKYEVNRSTADLYYGRKPVFKKICVRYTANRLKKAWSMYNSQDYENASFTFDEIYNYSESYSALHGYIFSLVKLNETEKTLKILSEQINKFENTSYFYNLELLLGDLRVRNKNFDGADSLYKQLMIQNPNIRYSNSALTRSYLLGKDTTLIREFVEGSLSDKYFILKNELNENLNYHMVPVYIDISSSLEKNYDELVQYFDERITVSDICSSNAAFELSKYSVANSDYETAKDYCILALNYNADENFRVQVESHLRKINWFVNFGETVKQYFEYKTQN